MVSIFFHHIGWESYRSVCRVDGGLPLNSPSRHPTFACSSHAELYQPTPREYEQKSKGERQKPKVVHLIIFYCLVLGKLIILYKKQNRTITLVWGGALKYISVPSGWPGSCWFSWKGQLRPKFHNTDERFRHNKTGKRRGRLLDGFRSRKEGSGEGHEERCRQD